MKTKAEYQREYTRRKRAAGKTALNIWCQEGEPAEGYRQAWEVGSKEQIGQVLRALVANNELPDLIDKYAKPFKIQSAVK